MRATTEGYAQAVVRTWSPSPSGASSGSQPWGSKERHVKTERGEGYPLALRTVPDARLERQAGQALNLEWHDKDSDFKIQWLTPL